MAHFLQVNQMLFSMWKIRGENIDLQRYDIKNGVEEFQKLQFRKIYHEGPMGMEHDITEYRHSEVIREGGFPVEPFLQCILCRTQAERETLMFLSKMDD